MPQHRQDGGPSVEFYDVRERGGPGTILEGDIEFYLAQARNTGGPILELAGFRILAEYADFHGAPPRYGAEQICVAEAI